MGCTFPFGPNRDKCALENSTLSLEVVKGKRGSAEANRDLRSFFKDFPMPLVAQDLCPTGMKVGSPDMEWFFTYGKHRKLYTCLCVYTPY